MRPISRSALLATCSVYVHLSLLFAIAITRLSQPHISASVQNSDLPNRNDNETERDWRVRVNLGNADGIRRSGVLMLLYATSLTVSFVLAIQMRCGANGVDATHSVAKDPPNE